MSENEIDVMTDIIRQIRERIKPEDQYRISKTIAAYFTPYNEAIEFIQKLKKNR